MAVVSANEDPHLDDLLPETLPGLLDAPGKAWDALDASKSLILDSASFLSLVLDEMEDRGESIDERGPYEATFLRLAAVHQVRDPDLRRNAKRMLLLADDVLLPPVDVRSNMYTEKRLKYAPTASMRARELSDESLDELAKLARQMSLHPLAQTHGLGSAEIGRIMERWRAERSFGAKRDELSVLLEMLIVEAGVAQIHARQKGIPVASHGFFGWPTKSAAICGSIENSDGIVAIWFENAVASPEPRCVEHAFELREHPRISRWRSAMREWQLGLTTGSLSKEQVVDLIRDANEHVVGAQQLGAILPWWSTLVLMPLSVVASVMGLGWLSAGVMSVRGVDFYGKLVKAVTRNGSQEYDWYLMDTKGER